MFTTSQHPFNPVQSSAKRKQLKPQRRDSLAETPVEAGRSPDLYLYTSFPLNCHIRFHSSSVRQLFLISALSDTFCRDTAAVVTIASSADDDDDDESV